MLAKEEVLTAPKSVLEKEIATTYDRCNGKSWYTGSAGEAYTLELKLALIMVDDEMEAEKDHQDELESRR